MQILYTEHELDACIKKLADNISNDYKGESVLCIGVLKGCTIFMSHLFVKLKGDFKMDFMTLSSYKHGTKSGELKLIQDLDTDVSGKNVLIIEDIIDSGKTLAFTQKHLKQRGAKSIKTVSLVNKEQRRENYEIEKAQYIGFEYNDEAFIVGFGFDYMEKYRNLPAVYKMEESDF